jgi:hypothetical protein
LRGCLLENPWERCVVELPTSRNPRVAMAFSDIFGGVDTGTTTVQKKSSTRLYLPVSLNQCFRRFKGMERFGVKIQDIASSEA